MTWRNSGSIFWVGIGSKNLSTTCACALSLLDPRETREKTTEVMFETFNVLSLHLVQPRGRSTHACPVNGPSGGQWERDHLHCPHLWGLLPASCCHQALWQAGTSQSTSPDSSWLVGVITLYTQQGLSGWHKESACYVALEPEKELCKKPEEIMKEYKYQMGNALVSPLGTSRTRYLRFFTPDHLGVHNPGLSKWSPAVRHECDTDIQKNLWQKLFCLGEPLSSWAWGKGLRLNQNSWPSEALPTRSLLPDRCFSAWIGALHCDFWAVSSKCGSLLQTLWSLGHVVQIRFLKLIQSTGTA